MMKRGDGFVAIERKIGRPILPAVKPLPGQRSTLKRRVLGSDHCQRTAGRALSGARQWVGNQHTPAGFTQGKSGCRTDNAGTNNNGIKS